MKRPIVIVETPFAGDRERNDRYLRACLRDSYLRGEAPYASHAIGPLALNDDDPAERAMGIEAGFEFHAIAKLSAVYVDLGYSRGMLAGMAHAKSIGLVIEERSLPDWRTT